MNRRTWLKKMGRFFLWVGLSYPLYAFVTEKRYRPPKEIRIRKTLRSGEFMVEKDFILFMTDKGPKAVSRHCTHLGCILRYHDDKKMFLCPCHQSRFKWDGTYISGPAKKDLPLFKVVSLENEQGFKIEIPRGEL